jgi:hypothetical protein
MVFGPISRIKTEVSEAANGCTGLSCPGSVKRISFRTPVFLIGTPLAHPFNQEKTGVNLIDEPDTSGNSYVRQVIDRGHNGYGFVRFILSIRSQPGS